MLTQALIKANENGEINLDIIGASAQSYAEILQLSVVGLKSKLTPLKTFKRLNAFVKIFAGLETPKGDKPVLTKAHSGKI